MMQYTHWVGSPLQVSSIPLQATLGVNSLAQTTDELAVNVEAVHVDAQSLKSKVH